MLNNKNGVECDYFDRYEEITDIYLSPIGEGETIATQTITAVNKLVYKWYNDGDVFDNSYILKGWVNDLSSYANWLYKHITATQPILDRIMEITTEQEYEHLLKDLADIIYNKNQLCENNQKQKVGTIYDCDGDFKFIFYCECGEELTRYQNQCDDCEQEEL